MKTNHPNMHPKTGRTAGKTSFDLAQSPRAASTIVALGWSLTRQRRRAILLTEAVVSLAIVGIVLTATSLAIARYGRSADYYLNHRRVQLVAEAQIERMRAGALPVVDASFTTKTGVSCDIRVEESDDAWAPLRLVRVTAACTGRHGRVARCERRAYVKAHSDDEGGNG